MKEDDEFADYILEYIAERKRADDLGASLRDGRYGE